MADIRINYLVNSSEVDKANASLKNLDNSTEETTESTEELNASTLGLSDQLKNVANKFTIAGKGAGDMASSLTGTAKAAGTAAKASKVLSLAMKAIPIIAIVAALGSLVSFFTKTERGAQKLRVITAFLGGAMGAVSDVVVSLGENLFNAISSPQQAFEDLKNSFVSIFVEFIPNAIQKVMDGFGLLGKSISQLFEGDFSGAMESAKEGAIKLGDGLTDLNPATAILKKVAAGAAELGVEIAKDAQAAADLEGRLNKVLVAERELSVARAQANAEIAQQKLIAEDVTKSFEEREAAALKAFKLENDLVQEELKLQRERLAIILAQNELNESDEEALQAAADARIQLAAIEQASASKLLEINNKLNSLRKEQAAKKEEDAAKEQARLDAEEQAELDRIARKKEASTELAIFQAEQRDDQVAAEILRRERLLENEALIEEERALIIEQSEAKIKDIKEKSIQEQQALNESAANARIQLEQTTTDSLFNLLKTLGNNNAVLMGTIFAFEKARAISEIFVQLAKQKAANAVIGASLPTNIVTGGAAGLAYVARMNTLANINAALNVGTVAAQIIAAPKFAKGVIDLQGAGTGTSDSIPSMLSKGESVMTARETQDFLPTLSAIRKGYIDPDVLNGIAKGGGVIDNTKVINVPTTSFHLDENGFAAYMMKKSGKVIKKQKMFSN